jgi:hypothetical protein
MLNRQSSHFCVGHSLRDNNEADSDSGNDILDCPTAIVLWQPEGEQPDSIHAAISHLHCVDAVLSESLKSSLYECCLYHLMIGNRS